MTQRATSLGPKPSLCFCLFVFVLVFVVFVFFFLFLFVFLRFKGQVKWPKGPPHLALNPPYFLFVFFVFFFLGFSFLVLNRKALLPPLKRAFLCIFLCLPLFLFSLFWAPKKTKRK